MAISTSPSTSGPVLGFETISSVMPAFSERKSRRIGIAKRWAKDVGRATFSTRFGRPFSLMTSPSAWSMRSNDFVTTGKMWRPASVSTSCCGRRSNRATPRKFSRTITWRLTALCATVRLLAAAVKLRCCPAASNALRAFSGNHLRSIHPPRASIVQASPSASGCGRDEEKFITQDEALPQYGRAWKPNAAISARSLCTVYFCADCGFGEWANALPEARPDRLQVHVLVDRMRRAVASEARLPEAAERRSERRAVVRVDPDRAGADGARQPMRCVHVARPHRGGKAVDRVVGEPHRLGLGRERNDHDDRSKNFFLSDVHGVGGAVKNRRLHIEPAGLGERASASVRDPCAFLLAKLDIAEHAVHLPLLDHRAE